MICSLSDFKLPEPDVRLISFDDAIYKIKLRYRETSIPQETNEQGYNFWKKAQVQYDIERIIRYVLYNKGTDELEPIRTDQLVVYPYKKEWTNAHKLKFFKHDVRLKTSPYLFLLYVERLHPVVSQESQNEEERQSMEPCEDNNGNGGYAHTFFKFLMTPMKTIRNIWQ